MGNQNLVALSKALQFHAHYNGKQYWHSFFIYLLNIVILALFLTFKELRKCVQRSKHLIAALF